MGSNPIDKNVNRNLESPWTFRIKQHTNAQLYYLEAQRHQIKIATSKLSHSMIFFKLSHVTDEFHKSQVQNNSFTMIMLQMNLERSSMMYQMKFQIASTQFHKSWHWPSPLAQECCLNSKSICPRSSQQSTQEFFRIFVVIMYINGQRPHKQTKYTQKGIYHTIWSKWTK